MSTGSSWSQSLAEYIRCNDQLLITQSDALVSYYEQKLLTTEQFEQFLINTGELWEHKGEGRRQGEDRVGRNKTG